MSFGMNTPQVLAGLLAAAAIMPVAQAQNQVVNVYNWAEYTAPDTLSGFQKATGITVRYGGGGALLAPELAKQLDLEPQALQRWFEAASYGDQASKVGQGGRQAAWFVNGPFGQAVLRHYRRGGLVARFNESAYLWQGASRTRSWREFQVMSYLHNKGLAVPKVLAGAWWQHGFCYRAALISQRVPDVQPLSMCLDRARPEAVAHEIVRMHQFEVWHADLNAYNILLDANDKVWLIDFDRARQGPVSPAQALGNVQRLRRSLLKVCGSQGDRWWQQMFSAYRHETQR